MIDPTAVYRLATVVTKNGLHTFPTRDGQPVILDPFHTRNVLRGALSEDVAVRRMRIERLIGTDETRGVRGDLARAKKAKSAGHTTWVHGEPIDQAIESYERALATYQGLLAELPRNGMQCTPGPGPVALAPADAIDWLAELAAERADRFEGGAARVANGRRALRGVLALKPICIADLRDVIFLLALAERGARHLGRRGFVLVQSCAKAIDAIDRVAADGWIADACAAPRADAPRNAFELKIGNTMIKPNLSVLGALGRVGTRIAGGIGIEALKLKLASMGVSPAILSSFEGELNREGLSMGPLATPPPMLGTLGAMRPEALAARWLSKKL